MTVKTRPRWRAIHLACHGLVDTARPLRSALALSIDERGPGLLTCADIYRTRLATDLAVLSACRTGQGTIYRIEGIVGLTQAFMLAGAPRVLVSLWDVDDEATAAFMTAFYKHWNPKDGSGASATKALRAAQDAVRKDKRWKHPSYWSAWVLWGLPD